MRQWESGLWRMDGSQKFTLFTQVESWSCRQEGDQKESLHDDHSSKAPGDVTERQRGGGWKYNTSRPARKNSPLSSQVNEPIGVEHDVRVPNVFFVDCFDITWDVKWKKNDNRLGNHLWTLSLLVPRVENHTTHSQLRAHLVIIMNLQNVDQIYKSLINPVYWLY